MAAGEDLLSPEKAEKNFCLWRSQFWKCRFHSALAQTAADAFETGGSRRLLRLVDARAEGRIC